MLVWQTTDLILIFEISCQRSYVSFVYAPVSVSFTAETDQNVSFWFRPNLTELVSSWFHFEPKLKFPFSVSTFSGRATSASAERSFSALCRLKTCIRSMVGPSRLKHLLLVRCHHDCIDKLDLRLLHSNSFMLVHSFISAYLTYSALFRNCRQSRMRWCGSTLGCVSWNVSLKHSWEIHWLSVWQLIA